jgi:hypothetical protein
LGLLFRTRLTVPRPTPALRATSPIVTGIALRSFARGRPS